MGVVTRGFVGRRDPATAQLPPGQYLTPDFPVLSAGPTPRIPLDQWRFTVTNETGSEHGWTWSEFLELPNEQPTVDIHCVTKWSKLGTRWQGVSLDTVLGPVQTRASYALVRSYGGYSTNLPLAELRGGKAWIAFENRATATSSVPAGVK